MSIDVNRDGVERARIGRRKLQCMGIETAGDGIGGRLIQRNGLSVLESDDVFANRHEAAAPLDLLSAIHTRDAAGEPGEERPRLRTRVTVFSKGCDLRLRRAQIAL